MNKKQAIEEAIFIVSPNIEQVFLDFNTRGNYTNKLDVTEFINLISKPTYNLNELGKSYGTISRLLKELFPNRQKATKPCTSILLEVGLKVCTHCGNAKFLDEFRQNSAKSGGVNTYCKPCHLETTTKTQPHRQSKYSNAKINRTPKWADMDKIKAIYDKCPEGYHVDHVIPLQGELVSGLHVENNLQYLTASENASKKNKFSIE